MALVTPHAWTAGDDATSGNMQTLTDAISQLRGGTPTGSGTVLDYAKLRQTATQTLTTAVWGSITFTTEDADAAAGHSIVTNTSRYVVSVAGELQVEAGVTFAANTTGVRGMRIAKNGTAVPQGRVIVSAASSGSTELALCRTITAAAGDYIEVQGYQTSGGNLDTAYATESGCFMNVRWVHT